MIILAVVLLVLILVFSVAIVVGNPGVYELSIFRMLIPVTSAGVYFTGIGASVLTALAIWLLRAGIKRRRLRRSRLKAAETQKAVEPSPSRASESSLDLNSGDGNTRDAQR